MSYMKKPAIVIPVAASTLILMGGYALPAYAEIDPPHLRLLRQINPQG